MQALRKITIVLALTAFATVVGAQETQTLGVTVSAIDNVTLGTAPTAMTLSARKAGTDSTEVGTASSSLTYESNAIVAEARSIVVKIDAATSGLTLVVAPTVSGVGTGATVTLSATDQTLISGIAAGTGSATLAYSAQAAMSLAPGVYDKTVTYTILAP